MLIIAACRSLRTLLGCVAGFALAALVAAGASAVTASATLATLAGCTKADLQAAVNAADDWADANAAGFNAALPTAFSTNATAGQKALLLAVVALARFDGPTLRTLLGEVD